MTCFANMPDPDLTAPPEPKANCPCCGLPIIGGEWDTVSGEDVCLECVENAATVCDVCGKLKWTEDIRHLNGKDICEACLDQEYYGGGEQ